MLIKQLIEPLTNQAVITTLTPTKAVIYDNNELKVYVGFTNKREIVEYTKEVVLLLSTTIPPKADIREIIVSKNGDYVILEGSRSVFVVRIGTELLFTKPDRLSSECFCESYPLHDSLLLQNASLSVVKTRILTEKCDENTVIVAILFSDNCIRFYNLQKKFDSFLLSIDFRNHLHHGTDENVANNTFGLQKRLVSFDLIPPRPNLSHFSLIAVDSDAEFYASFVHFACFKEGIPPRIHRLQVVDGLPCDPLDLQYIKSSSPRIASVFVLVSGGGILSHLVVFPNEFGEFQLLVNDQLRLPRSTGDPVLVKNHIKKLNVNRYEVVTSSCLYSINISPWFDALTSSQTDRNANQESRVSELVNALIESDEFSNTEKWTGARALRAVALEMAEKSDPDECEDDVLPESEDVMHLVILENKYGLPDHVFNIATFDSTSWNIKESPERGITAQAPVSANSKSTLEHCAELKPLVACVISDKVPRENAIEAALKFLEAVDERLKKHSELAQAFVDRCLALAATAHTMDERQQNVDQRLIEETNSVEELKVRMHATKERMETARKNINVLFHRVEENVPLSDNEVRIFERLKEHQKMLSDMSIFVPKMTLDSNELNRMSEILIKKRGAGEEPNKFAAVEKNAADIESLEARENKLKADITQIAA